MSVPIETITDEILAENGFYWRESGAIKILTCRPLEEKGFANGFSTRLGGVSDFPKNSLNLSGFDIDSPENVADKSEHSRVSFDIQAIADVVMLIVTHDRLKAGSEMAKGISKGWPLVLSGLKSFLETGKAADILAIKNASCAQPQAKVA